MSKDGLSVAWYDYPLQCFSIPRGLSCGCCLKEIHPSKGFEVVLLSGGAVCGQRLFLFLLLVLRVPFFLREGFLLKDLKAFLAASSSASFLLFPEPVPLRRFETLTEIV